MRTCLLRTLWYSLLLCTSCVSKPAYFTQAMQAYKQQHYAVANDLFRRVRRDDANANLTFFYRGRCLVKLDSLAPGIALLQQALAKDLTPKTTVLLSLGDAYNQQGNYDKSFNAFFLASLLDSTLRGINTNAGIALLNGGHTQRAIHYLRRDYDHTRYSKKTIAVLADAYDQAQRRDSAAYFEALLK